MTVCIVGHKGNMGRRYASILNYLGKEWVGCDVGEPLSSFEQYIIATPTTTHVDLLRIAKGLNSESIILCEKPITTDITEFERIPKEYWDDIFMVNQYACLSNFVRFSWPEGITYYDFYHSGQDGIAWDCIQLIHLALDKNKIILRNKSPIWKAQINGWPIGKEEIDHSYISMMRDFLGEKNHSWNLHKAYEAHQDVVTYLEARNDN